MTRRVPFILTDAGRYCDLMKQGFMKPIPTRKPAKVQTIVSCYGCLNWHKQGKHTVSDPVERRANFKTYNDTQRRVGWPHEPKMERVT